jgi:ferredoxin-thioredoxin reductase catalytic subunit
MDVNQLFDILRKAQKPLGYFFNIDKQTTFDLLNSLLINKERYGYTSCPCRLASGIYEKDTDIICPCVYRVPDVKEYGSCYCGLYVSKEWNDGEIPHVYVPERRPKEKMPY